MGGNGERFDQPVAQPAAIHHDLPRSPGVTATARHDPPGPPRRLVIVSLKLECFTAAPDSIFAQPVEIVQPNARHGIPPGMWVPLTQDHFSWMVAGVDRLANKVRSDDPDLLKARRDLRWIAVEAVAWGVFGEWALQEELWPWTLPRGYQPPTPSRPEFVASLSLDVRDEEWATAGAIDLDAWERLKEFDRDLRQRSAAGAA
jgi:hypothetical protein